jgi:bile acid-coenzyme A ligase
MGMAPSYQARRRGRDSWCLRHADEVLSWAELDERSTRRANALASVGVGQDDLVMLALPNSNALFELTFAAWKLGATPSVVSAALPIAELAGLVELAAPAALVAAGELTELRRDVLPPTFGLDHSDLTPLEPRVARYWKVMASGGSTGRPKLIVDRRPAEMDPAVGVPGVPHDSVVLPAGPYFHNMPFASAHLALLVGSAVTGMARFDPIDALRTIERDRVNWASFVPTMMRRIWALSPEQREAFDLSSLEAVWHTAAPMPEWLKRAWIDWLGPDRIFEAYGGSEGVGVTQISGREWLEHPGSVGRPAGCSVKVLDPEGRPVVPEGTGEIFFFPLPGAGEAFHYVGADTRRGPDGSISLGDQGRMDEDGFLYIAGRRTDLILVGGENVYPAEIESVLSACRGVAAAVVIGLPDDDLGERIHAIVEPIDPSEPPSEAALRAEVEVRLARRKRPQSYEVVDRPLRDAAGKVRRAALREARTDGATAGGQETSFGTRTYP